MAKKATETIHEIQESRKEKELPASPVSYPEQKVATLKLIFRLVYFLVYLVLGLILAPIIAYVILAISLPKFWKSSAKVFKKGKKPIKFNPPQPTKEEMKFVDKREIEASVGIPKYGIYSGRDGHS